MTAKNILESVKAIKIKKKEEQEKKNAKIAQREEQKVTFLRCKENCVCDSEKCKAAGLKQCPKCKNVLRSICSRVGCRSEDGKKPKMITIPSNKPKKSARRKISFRDVEPTDESSDDFDSSFTLSSDDSWDSSDEE